MSNNTNIINIESTLIENKVSQLSEQLSVLSQSNVSQTKEELIDQAIRFLRTFFTQLSNPIFIPTTVFPNQKPDVVVFNQALANILFDLKIIFAELENIESIILSHFNFMVSDSNNILNGLKQVYSKLGDYVLFSKTPTKDSFFFSDSFNNFSRIDLNSPLLNSEQCNIDQIQGIITLPYKTSGKTVLTITEFPIINSNSNGTPGNSIEDATGLSADINRIIDNNSDTWFEYERIVDIDDGVPLILDLVINLSDPQIINYIRINPNNFGTKNQVAIDTIETSVDGKSYVSIKDDVPLNGFISQDDDNVFLLAPSTSKFAGQGIYTFNPRKVKYVHLIFRQFSPYGIIDSGNNTKLRYAIGIRDIEISAITYSNSGEIISVNFESSAIIKKLALITNQNPTQTSILASIKHYLSVDNGSTWNQIEAEDFIENDSVPKILNFNTIDKNSINTQAQVKSVRYKAVLFRNKDNFAIDIPSDNGRIENIVELQRIPAQTPFEISLKRKPIPESIAVLDPSFGSRGVDSVRYNIGIGTGTAVQFNLPFNLSIKDFNKTIINNEYILTELSPEEIRINGQLWSRGFLTNAAPTASIYELDEINNTIKFGDNANGRAVPQGNKIDIKFTPERLFITSQDHSAQLTFPTSRDKKSVSIKRYTAESIFSEVIKKNSKVHKLINQNINNQLPITFSDTTVFANKRSFIDGSTELLSNGDWSIDASNGIVYSFIETSISGDTSVLYTYKPSNKLADTDWDFSPTDLTKIIINENAFASIITNETIPTNRKYFILGNLSVLQGTVRFNDNVVFQKEVPFLNGRIELTNNIKTTEAIGSVISNNNIRSFFLRMPVVNDITYEVVFSDKLLFATRVFNLSEVDGPNKYYINLNTRQVSVYIGALPDQFGNVSYYYQNQAKRVNGLYSINYHTGEVFTSVLTGDGTTVEYQYAHFIISYPVARQLTVDDFMFDSVLNIIKISEREILNRTNLNSTTGSTQSNFYQITFNSLVNDSINPAELEPFFTPMLKDYAIKIIPEGALLF